MKAQRQGEERVTLRITLMCKRFENLGSTLAEGTSCYCCAFYSLLSSPPPLPPLLLCVLDITSLLLLLHWGLFEKVEIFCLHMYLIVLSRVQVLNAGGTPSLHHQCKATTETWGCRTPLRSMRHSRSIATLLTNAVGRRETRPNHLCWVLKTCASVAALEAGRHIEQLVNQYGC